MQMGYSRPANTPNMSIIPPRRHKVKQKTFAKRLAKVIAFMYNEATNKGRKAAGERFAEIV